MGKCALGCLFLVAFVVSGSVPPIDTNVYGPSGPAVPERPLVATATRLAGWYPIYHTGGQAWYLQVDGARGRILVAAWYYNASYDPNSSAWFESWNLLVLDMSGRLLHNLSLAHDVSQQFAGLAVDSSNGQVYVSLRNGTVVHVDPNSGQILNWWTYWSGLTTLVAQQGEVWVGLCCNAGTVMRLSGSTGAVLRNYTIAGQGEAISIAVDPAGRWFFVALSGPLVGDLYRVDTGTGVTTGFGPGNTVLLSADGKRIWLCGWYPLAWYWLANDTYGGSGVSCADSIAENPVTGVFALAGSGRFIDVTGEVGRFHFQENVEGPWQAMAVGWSANGTALVALAWSLTDVTVGLWDGDPWLNATQGLLLNPHRDPICYPLVTVGGIDASSVILYRDGVELGRGTPRMTQACFGFDLNPDPIPDGPHVGRIVGIDRVGRSLDAMVTFETDGTPPQITITSGNMTETVPYLFTGTVDEPHLGNVSVNDNPATVSGRTWSSSLDLGIGNNTLGVSADDTLQNYATEVFVVRYWPRFERNLTSQDGLFRVSVPPGWTGSTPFAHAGVTFGAALFAPRDGSYVYNTSVTVVSHPRPGIEETQTVAYAEAMAGAKEVARYAWGSPGFFRNLTVDGHPATQILATVGNRTLGPNTTTATLFQTYIVSGSQGRVYVVSFNVSWHQPKYSGTGEWILESFHIESVGPPLPRPLPIAIVLVAAVGGAAAVGAAAFLLWTRWRSMGSRRPPT